MFALLILASAAILYCTCTYFNDHEVYYRYLQNTADEELNLNESFFPKLLNYRLGGEDLYGHEYLWIAKVVHSRIKPGPYICTTVCIKDKIFISAARCVSILKVTFTSIIYQEQRLSVKALVMPSNTTKQLYDDIGFIITNNEFKGTWALARISNIRRTDRAFKWFKNLKFENFQHKVVGFASPQTLIKLPIWHQTVTLVQLDVVVGIELCEIILSYNSLISGFPVPCYHSCSIKMYNAGNKTCKNYLGVEGAALIHKPTSKLFGIATWGASDKKCVLPVGFSVPNSESFFEDLECALKIRDNNENVTGGFFQSLCDSKRR